MCVMFYFIGNIVKGLYLYMYKFFVGVVIVWIKISIRKNFLVFGYLLSL